jgi:hypothetical protein
LASDRVPTVAALAPLREIIAKPKQRRYSRKAANTQRNPELKIQPDRHPWLLDE